jgi:hypothetical protein
MGIFTSSTHTHNFRTGGTHAEFAWQDRPPVEECQGGRECLLRILLGRNEWT